MSLQKNTPNIKSNIIHPQKLKLKPLIEHQYGQCHEPAQQILKVKKENLVRFGMHMHRLIIRGLS